MKIDKDVINAKTISAISQIIGEPIEYVENRHTISSILCEVRGALYLADVLRNALKEIEVPKE